MPFPAHRAMCHQCNDNVNNSVCADDIAGMATVCELYVPNDPCFIRRTGIFIIYLFLVFLKLKFNLIIFVLATTVTRGCLSSSNYCRANVTNCFTCMGVGCNFRNITMENVPESPEGEPGSANIQRSTIFMSLLGFFIITILNK